MRGTNKRWRWGGLLILAAALAGCNVAVDLLNPTLLTGLGLDVSALTRNPGDVIVAFVNDSGTDAQFFAFATKDATDVTKGARNFSAFVEAGKVSNEVLDCPVGYISPGSLGADFAIDTVGAIVAADTTDTNAATVDYTAPGVVVESSFECGDVVEIRLGTSAGGALQLRMRVIPGR